MQRDFTFLSIILANFMQFGRARDTNRHQVIHPRGDGSRKAGMLVRKVVAMKPSITVGTLEGSRTPHDGLGRAKPALLHATLSIVAALAIAALALPMLGCEGKVSGGSPTGGPSCAAGQ